MALTVLLPGQLVAPGSDHLAMHHPYLRAIPPNLILSFPSILKGPQTETSRILAVHQILCSAKAHGQVLRCLHLSRRATALIPWVCAELSWVFKLISAPWEWKTSTLRALTSLSCISDVRVYRFSDYLQIQITFYKSTHCKFPGMVFLTLVYLRALS